MIRIYADFNHCDEQGRVLLDTVGSLADISEHEAALAQGMVVLLYMEDEFEVEGTLLFDRVWRAVPDFGTLRYLEGPSR
jgi:hypothetical protein